MKRFPRAGFTLIEILVVLGVMAVVSASMITYGSSSRQQIALATETAKLTQLILRAKSLTISTYSASANVCGYGMELDYAANRYNLVSYVLNNCDNPNTITARNVIETFRLSNSVVLAVGVGNNMRDIIFLPPDPLVYASDLNGDSVTARGGTVLLNTVNGMGSKVISVSSLGQVSF